MTNQMEVFLQENTESFIDSLFVTLESGEYVNGPPKVVSRKVDADDDGKYEEGKPDSTTSTPANVSELASDLKEAEHKSTNRSPDVCNFRISIFYFLLLYFRTLENKMKTW